MTASGNLDVVVGAGSAIGRALIQRWHAASERPILALARSPSSLEAFAPLGVVRTQLCDYGDAALERLAKELREEQSDVERLVICNGVLQGEGYRPERALNQLDLSAMHTVFEVNAFTPMRVLAALAPILKRSRAPRVAVLSARVGSIGDNLLGGWYSYRGSKAALNMMLKSAALELRRLNPSATLLAYHPGTVDTPLSKPFHETVNPETLLTPERAAEALDGVLAGLMPAGELSYLDWRGEVIPW
jgi:NAD(P)-dependent dehydrogenase (short-subunit alcohol dehydrogenase family)